MGRQIAAAFCSLAVGLIALSSPGIAQHRTAKICAEVARTSNNKGQAETKAEKDQTACHISFGKSVKDRQVYLSVKDIMDAVIDPSADTLWGAVGTVMDKQGIRDLSPKTPEEWLDVRRAAVRIVEGANLLQMRGRDAAPAGAKSDTPGVELEPAEIAVLIKRKRKSFDAYAGALQALALEAMRASEAKDTASLIEIGGRMEDVCESCHKTFWYPPQKQASKPN